MSRVLSVRFFTTVFLTVFLAAASAWAGDPTGTWKWTAEGAGGRKMDTTLELKLQGDQLSGSIDNRLGQVDIRDAKLAGEQVSFTVERKIRRRKITVKYNGTLEGDTIKGTIETTGRDQQPVTVPWNAERVK